MLKLEFTNDEMDYIKSKVHFTPIQERIMDYRRDELTIVQMALKEGWSESKISKEINKISRKIDKVIR